MTDRNDQALQGEGAPDPWDATPEAAKGEALLRELGRLKRLQQGDQVDSKLETR